VCGKGEAPREGSEPPWGALIVPHTECAVYYLYAITARTGLPGLSTIRIGRLVGVSFSFV
jgi:hypothetical protein